ncbi:MAG: iron-containing alcohol dehydrogenase family protein [Thermoplasmatota archaeon]
MKGDLLFGTDISYGWGIIDSLPEILPEGRAVLVLGRDPDRAGKLENRIRNLFRGEIDVFMGVEANPSAGTVEKGAKFISGCEPDIVIAAGGGSVMDAAKFMSVLAGHGGEIIEYINGSRSPPDSGYPVFAIPTTPGTSSEITPFSIVTVPELNNKVGLRHPAIYPRKAVIDPSLTVPLPKDQTAATGFDILSHSVESYWAKKATPLTRQFSLNAIRLLREHLKTAYDDGTDRAAREGVSLASIFAGLSFSNTGTTICHAISYPVTFDTGLPHGMACALSLGPTFDLLAERGVEGMDRLAESFGSSIGTFRVDLLSMMDGMDVPTSLGSIGFEGGPGRIMSTNIAGFQSNFTIELSDRDVESIINGMERA